MPKLDPKIQALAESLRTVVGCDNDRNWEPVREFWARKAQRDITPDPIVSPDEYCGSEYLSISCTQTDLPVREQRKLVERWCELLPTLKHVRWLWFYSRVPQELFDAACRLEQLEALYFKWTGVTDFSSLTHCPKLKYLHIGSSASAKSIEPLGKLTQLKWLQIDNVKAATSVEPLSSLTNLEGLGFTGSEFRRYTLESFDPLANLTKLQWLHLGAVHTKDLSLRAFAGLKDLQFLGVGNYFPVAELAWLSLQLDSSVCQWLNPYVRMHSSVFPCCKCKKNWKVKTSGKGSKLLCPTCDSVKLARHVARFNAARAAAQAVEGCRVR
jgi:hypothetical protein